MTFDKELLEHAHKQIEFLKQTIEDWKWMFYEQKDIADQYKKFLHELQNEMGQ